MPEPKQILTTVLGLILVGVLLTQCRKPTWWFGRMYLWLMNFSHSRLTDWGLTHISIEKGFTILDVGCGGGRTIRKLAALAPEGKICGLDYSAASVAASRRTNRQEVEAGRVDIRHGSVSSVPFPDRTFDLVTAVETHYYWPDLVANFRELLRVLKPGGSLVIIAEAYRGGRFGQVTGTALRFLGGRCLSVDEHRNLLSSAGYSEIAIAEEPKRGWICCVARKPA